MRIIVSTVEQCYITLGAVHNIFHPVSYLGLRDFIASPKPNGYRSIHTNVIGPNGHIVEVQIRTHEMHEQAELGVAAHWYYSEKKAAGAPDAELERGIKVTPNKLDWVKQLALWQKDITNHEQYLRALKFDALQHRNLVFSPKGDVFDLPIGATPIDFAYAVHTQVGNQATGAKVNGKMVAMSYKLENGDIVEIVVDRGRKKPNPDWLQMSVTTMAHSKIKAALRDDGFFGLGFLRRRKG
jgi:(p)ppGpp synthase/HD superfamily hydrolase